MTPLTSAQPLRGIALKVASTLVFTAMSTLIKLVSDRYPVGEIVFFRSSLALIPVAAWVGWREFPFIFRTTRFPGHVVRSVAGSASMFCSFSALSLLPIADATAISYASPLLTVIFAVILLHEKVHAYRWSAVAVGLFGVLVILSDYFGPEAGAVSARRHAGSRAGNRRRRLCGACRDADAQPDAAGGGGDHRRLLLEPHRAVCAGDRAIRLEGARGA